MIETVLKDLKCNSILTCLLLCLDMIGIHVDWLNQLLCAQKYARFQPWWTKGKQKLKPLKNIVIINLCNDK